MTTPHHYDAIVIGSGQGGGPLAQALAKAGRRTALIEAKHVGGTCVNEGCTPTKTMVASARVAHLACRGESYGVQIKKNSLVLKMEKVRQRKRNIVESFRTGSENRIRATEGLDLIMGTARFTGPKAVEVVLTSPKKANSSASDAAETTTENQHPQEDHAASTTTLALTGDQIFINAGCSPATLQAKNVDVVRRIGHANVLDSTSIMELAEVPRHLVVLGGGAIGCEFAQMMRRFGARVSLVQRASQLLPNEDPDVAAEMLKILVDAGIDVYLGAQTRELSTITLGQIVVQLELGQNGNHGGDRNDGHGHGQTGGDGSRDDFNDRAGGIKTLLASHVLVAIGRNPNTEPLNLQAAGVEVDARGFIKVDEHLRTTAADVYALGDIKGGPAQTHVAYDDYRVLRDNLIPIPIPGTPAATAAAATGGKQASIADRLIPYTIFTDPQLGRVGLTEKAAREQGRRIKVAKMPMKYVARALEMDETLGFMKAVVDTESKQILGFACLGIEGGEIMTMVQLAMLGGLTYDKLENAMFAHPSLSESLNNLWGFLE
ncbi:hypothetical protein A1O3_00602 [Capronia epimyces CBS 606.96]|uniref:Mercuric reductase n=1 Tax=Capronia epimyces CBS 606.96 TaxID=1182542 RepID=W9YGN2_9EURO|nr:uncharacterized protein A1O3_00602 [Capronia epimyces CBS 606.96]EXJ92052.1 hypothetical protein A1O3_00602 [Capronia epimyces CBS 606.96]